MLEIAVRANLFFIFLKKYTRRLMESVGKQSGIYALGNDF